MTQAGENSDGDLPVKLFYALWPDDATRLALMKMQDSLHGRKTRFANLHMTLVFLGNQPLSAIPALKTVLSSLAVPEINLSLNCIGYFKRQRIAWAGLQEVPEELVEMHRSLIQALEKTGIDFDWRSTFTPHVTLAREAKKMDHIPFEPICWHADRIALIQSVMQPDGVEYRVLAARSMKSHSR